MATRALFFGDSISDETYGQYRALVCTHYGWQQVAGDNNWGGRPGVPLRAAIGGTLLQSVPNKAYAGVDTYALRVCAFEPDVIVVAYGTNDYFYSTPFPGNAAQTTPAAFRAAARTVLTAFAALPRMPRIVTLGLFPYPRPLDVGIPAWATSPEDVLDQMDTVLCGETQAVGGTFVLMRDRMTAAMFAPDGIHPSATVGQPFIAERIIETLGG